MHVLMVWPAPGEGTGISGFRYSSFCSGLKPLYSGGARADRDITNIDLSCSHG